jgi:hypothetical protein
MFQVEALEPRILLSADPVMGLAADLFMSPDNDAAGPPASLMDAEATENRIDDALRESGQMYDISDLKEGVDYLDAALTIGSGDRLGGSGALDVELVNKGTLAPGHSPGVTNVANYTQDAAGALVIEIAGTGAPGAIDGYDQLNVTNDASFDGLLDVKILTGYDPTPGDTFDIITYGSSTGKFADGDGLFGFKEDYYFEVVQSDTMIQLVVRELVPGQGLALDLVDQAINDDLGMLINRTYFSSAAASIELQGSFAADEFVSASGTFIFETGSKTVNIASPDPLFFDGLPDYSAELLVQGISEIDGNPVDGMAIYNGPNIQYADGTEIQTGDLLVSAAEDEYIYRITPDGEQSLFAGIQTTSNEDTAPKLETGFERQFGLTFNDDCSILYALDKDNDNIRQIDMTTGQMYDYYNFGIRDGWNDGNTTGPRDMAIAGNGDMYVSVWNGGNDDNNIWLVPADGTAAVSVISGIDAVGSVDIHTDPADGLEYLYVVDFADDAANAGSIEKYALDGTFIEDVALGAERHSLCQIR